MTEIVQFFSGNFVSMYFFSCVGSLVLWMKSNARAKQVNSLGDIIDHIFPAGNRFGEILKFLVFVLFGGFLAVLVVAPATAIQAMTAGVAWSRVVAKD